VPSIVTNTSIQALESIGSTTAFVLDCGTATYRHFTAGATPKRSLLVMSAHRGRSMSFQEREYRPPSRGAQQAYERGSASGSILAEMGGGQCVTIATAG
jgi:hypothetical protein